MFKIPDPVPTPMDVVGTPPGHVPPGPSHNQERGEGDRAPSPEEEEVILVDDGEDSPSSGETTDGQRQTLADIKLRRTATKDQMALLISKVEEEFDNEVLRVTEETKAAVLEMQKYGEMVVAHVQAQRADFLSVVKAGMQEFEEADQRTAKNIQSLDFIQNQISNTFRQTGLL